MKFYLCISILFLPLISYPDNYSIQEIRRDYIASIENKKAAVRFFEKMTRTEISNPLVNSYLGVAYALEAKHNWNPYLKFNYLKESLRILDESISQAPNDIEIRFHRFCIQYYIPSFLGLSSNLEKDRQFIISHLDNTEDKPEIVLRIIANFMLEKEQFENADQEKMLKKLVML